MIQHPVAINEAFIAACNEQPATLYKKGNAKWKQFSEVDNDPVIVLNGKALMQYYGTELMGRRSSCSVASGMSGMMEPLIMFFSWKSLE